MKNSYAFLFMMVLIGSTVISKAQSEDQIFYSSFRPEGWNIFLSKDNGKSFSPFTQHTSLDYDAKISPDGQWVVFTSERNGLPHLFIKHVEGDTLPRLLVESNSMQDQVDFSPDGQWMVFVSTHEGNADIYKLPFLPSDTLNISQAENLTQHPGGDFRPRYSNDGSMIAFSSDRAHETQPHSFFVFAMQRTGDIFIMTPDGGNVQRLTESDGWDGSPDWSTDDSQIVFYSDRNGEPELFRMTAKGENQEAISRPPYQCLSPLVMSENTLLFTSMNEAGVYSTLGLSMDTQEIDSSLVQAGDMFNVDHHPSGLLVYHGGLKPTETAANRGGFDGELLVQNSPENASLPGKDLELFGVRRAFAAPPMTSSDQLVYDHMDDRGLGDLITPFVFPVALLPMIAAFWFFFGVIKSIKKRKKLAFWKYLLLSVLSVAIAVGIGFETFNRFVANALPVSYVKTFLFAAAAILLVLAVIAWFFRKNRDSPDSQRLLQHYFFMLASYFVVTIYMAAFIGSFLEVKPDFYAVNYKTNEETHLFQFEPPADLNPQLVRVIDAKFTPDGGSLQFSVGGFRKNPSTQGFIYRYQLDSKTLTAVTDGGSNNAFADYSKDETSMVFRSGRTGEMDIFLQEGETVTNLTQSPNRENFPVISHDGSKIAYCSDVNGTDKDGLVKTVDIYLITRLPNNSWSEPEQLTTYSGQEGHPHFSPDGKWLIYASEEFGINDEEPLVQPYIFSPQMYGEITAIRLEDKQKFRLTHNKWEDGAPLWKGLD